MSGNRCSARCRRSKQTEPFRGCCLSLPRSLTGVIELELLLVEDVGRGHSAHRVSSSGSGGGPRLAVLRYHAGGDRDELSTLETTPDDGIGINPRISGC